MIKKSVIILAVQFFYFLTFSQTLDCTITASANPICLGDTAILSVNSNPSETVYWSDGSVGLDSIEVFPTQTTTYDVIISDGVNSCTQSMTIVVNNPQINAGQDQQVCAGKSSKTYYLGFIDEIEILKQPFNNKSLIDKKQSFCHNANDDLIEQNITGFEDDLLEMCSKDTLFNVRFKSENVHIRDFKFEEREIDLPHGWYRFNLYNLNKAPLLLEVINNYSK